MFEQAAAGEEEFVDALVSAQGRLNGVLHGCGGTKAHRREHVQAFDIAFCMMFRAVEYHPALTESGNAVGFRETVECNGQEVGGKRGDMVVYGVVVEDFVVNFVGKNNQAVFTC